MLEITPLYAMVLGVLMLILWFKVTKHRAQMQISIGDGGDTVLHEKIRRHGNFIEWVPLVLLMMLFAELRGAGTVWLHLAGALLVVSRALHPFGLRANNASHVLRIVGNSGSLLALLISIVGVGYTYLT